MTEIIPYAHENNTFYLAIKIFTELLFGSNRHKFTSHLHVPMKHCQTICAVQNPRLGRNRVLGKCRSCHSPHGLIPADLLKRWPLLYSRFSTLSPSVMPYTDRAPSSRRIDHQSQLSRVNCFRLADHLGKTGLGARTCSWWNCCGSGGRIQHVVRANRFNMWTIGLHVREMTIQRGQRAADNRGDDCLTFIVLSSGLLSASSAF